MTGGNRQIDVVGAVIIREGTILCARRGPTVAQAGMWEFPGGKVEPGERPPDALVREIREELGCLVEVGPRVTTTAHQYGFGVVSLTTHVCTLLHGEPVPTEHAEIRWVAPTALPELDWAPADIPAVEILADGAASVVAQGVDQPGLGH